MQAVPGLMQSEGCVRMEAFTILCAVYCFTVYLWTTTLTFDVKSSQRENGNIDCDQDHHGGTSVPNCTGPLCLPGTQCSYYSALIQSPNYPEFYPANQDIYWFLKLTKNISVDAAVITVEEFHVEKGHDWVNIGVRNHLDSRTVQESLTGILRRGQTYRIPFSFGFQVYMHFHSDNSIQFKGFKFSYNIVPKDPRHVQIVKLMSSSVLLRWEPSVTKPTDTITYKVYYGLYDNQSTLAGFQLVTGRCDYNLTGLRDSTSYFAYVVELLHCGQEDTGRMVNFTTRSNVHVDTLAPPVDLSVTEVEDGTVFVNWTPPPTAVSHLVEYRVYAVTDTETQVKATRVTYITLRNLETDQDYNITVTSVNTQGEGLPSNQITIRLQRHKPGEPALSITPVLAHTVTGSIRSSSLLLQLPACGLFDQIAENLRWEPSQNFTVYVLMVESAAVLSLSSDVVPDAKNATYGYTDGGRWGPYLAGRHLPVHECYRPRSRKEPIRDFGIFQVGSEEACSPTQTCNGLLRSNTTYRGRYVLMNDGTPILFSWWSELLTTRAVIPHQELQDRERERLPAPDTIIFTTIPIIFCLLLPLCLLGACFWRHKRTDQKSLVWSSVALGYLNPVQLSPVSAVQGGLTAGTSTWGQGGTAPQL